MTVRVKGNETLAEAKRRRAKERWDKLTPEEKDAVRAQRNARKVWNEARAERQRKRRAARTPEQVAEDNAAAAKRNRESITRALQKASPEYKARKLDRQQIRREQTIEGAQRWVDILGSRKAYEDIWRKLFEEQEGKCKICGKHQDDEGRRLHLDHCHLILTIRGLLCFSCNSKLGWLEKYAKQIGEYLT